VLAARPLSPDPLRTASAIVARVASAEGATPAATGSGAGAVTVAVSVTVVVPPPPLLTT
jgi:hypothetical protein